MFRPLPALFRHCFISNQSVQRNVENSVPKTLRNCKRFCHFDFLNRRDLLDLRNENLQRVTKRFAGHSKWANIKHIKAAKDAEKAAITSRFSRLIRQAVRDGGNKADPKLNLKLAQVLEQAKQKSVPNSTIETAIKGAIASKETLTPALFEIKGPGKCFLVVETLTDNAARTRQSIKAILNKTKSTMIEGISKTFFEYKGIVNVIPNTENEIEKAVNDAIEVGAEDVKETQSDDGQAVFQFLSDPRDFYTVKKGLEELKYGVHSSGLQYIASVKQPLSDNDLALTEKLYDLLGNLPEVVTIYDNIE